MRLEELVESPQRINGDYVLPRTRRLLESAEDPTYWDHQFDSVTKDSNPHKVGYAHALKGYAAGAVTEKGGKEKQKRKWAKRAFEALYLFKVYSQDNSVPTHVASPARRYMEVLAKEYNFFINYTLGKVIDRSDAEKSQVRRKKHVRTNGRR